MIRLKYNSQALALVLVLLLVATVIGLALYARSVRESERVIGERASAEANELVETVIGIVGMSDFSRVKGAPVLEKLGCIEEDLDTNEGCRKREISFDDLSAILESMVEADVDLSEFERVDDFCRSELMMRYGMQSDEVILDKDDVYGIFFTGITDWSSPGGCEVSFRVFPHDNPFGFVMTSLYKEDNYKAYEHSDILGFHFGDVTGSWLAYNDGDRLTFPSTNYPYSKGGKNLDEVRFTSIGGVSTLRWEMQNCPIDRYLVMEVGATCHGRYVAKRFNVPSEPFAPSIFDYVLFNGASEFKPERIDFN